MTATAATAVQQQVNQAITDRVHAGTGHCQLCRGRLQERLARVRHKYELTHPELEINRKIDQLTSKFRTARALLGNGEE